MPLDAIPDNLQSNFVQSNPRCVIEEFRVNSGETPSYLLHVVGRKLGLMKHKLYYF